jgi:hypothetical protein
VVVVADAADVACVHMVGGLVIEGDQVRWQCLDCGRVFASLELAAWAAQLGVPELVVRRFSRALAADESVAAVFEAGR